MGTQLAGVLFDKDGVFVDFERTWTPVLQTVARDLSGGDKALTVQLLTAAGFDVEQGTFLPASIWAAGHADDLADVWLPMLNGMERQAMIDRLAEHCARAPSSPVLPLDETENAFAVLKTQGLKLGVATNDSKVSAHAAIGAFGLSHIFDVVLGYDSVKTPKPSGEPVLEFCRKTGLEPAQVAMVGDNKHDVDCGRAGGAGLCIGVLSGNSTQAELAPICDHVVGDISDLHPLFVSTGRLS